MLFRMLERGKLRHLREKWGKKHQESSNPSHPSIKGHVAWPHRPPPGGLSWRHSQHQCPAVCDTGGDSSSRRKSCFLRVSWGNQEYLKTVPVTGSMMNKNNTKIQWWRAFQAVRWQRTCLPVQEKWVPALIWEGPLEEEMATHSSILAWRIS